MVKIVPIYVDLVSSRKQFGCRAGGVWIRKAAALERGGCFQAVDKVSTA